MIEHAVKAGFLALTLLAAVSGCGDDVCPPGDTGTGDAGEDGGIDSGRPDSGTVDAGSRDAGSRCGEIRPSEVYLSPVVRAVGPRETLPCSTSPLSSMRVRVFSDSGATVVDTILDCSGMGVALGDLPPGVYDVAVDYEQWSTGASLTRPADCADERTAGPHCPPIRFVVDPCDFHVVPVALHCDPAIGECASAAWPWLR